MRRVWLAGMAPWALAAAVVGGRPVIASAQGARVATNAMLAPEARQSAIERISVDLKQVPVLDAIDSIARRANMQVIRRGNEAPFTERVSLSLRGSSVSEALRAVTHATSAIAELAPDGSTITVRRATVEELREATRQAQGTIVGTVVNAKTKQPVRGATIFLDDANKGVQTDETGAFRLTATAGEHRITVRAVGFMRHARQVVVKESDRVAVAIALDPSASVLDEVVVTGTVVATQRREVTTPITVITADELEKRNITRIDQLFRGEVPGVVALDLGAASSYASLGMSQTSMVYARGAANAGNATPTPLKTYVDGVELLNPAYLGTIDPKSIERIEIVTGPQAATIYGSGAMGGVMQIFTKRGTRSGKPDITANLRYGMLESSLNTSYTPAHNHSLVINGGSGPEFSYSATGSYGYQGQWQPGLWNRNYGVSAGMTHTRGMVQIGGSASVTKTENGAIGEGSGSVCLIQTYYCYSTIVARSLQETGEIPRTQGVAGQFSSEVSGSFSQNVSFDVHVRPLSIWQHSLTVGRVTTAFNQEPQRPKFTTPSESLYIVRWSDGSRVTSNYSTTFAPRIGPLALNVSVGGTMSSGMQNEAAAFTLNPKRRTYTEIYVNDGSNENVPAMDDKSWGGFGLFRLGLFDRFYATFGLRGERNPTYGADHPVDWTPTYGMTYTIETGDLSLKLLASYGTATKSPGAGDRDAVYTTYIVRTPARLISRYANPHLGPERSHGPQGGFELSYGNLGSFTLNRYDQRVDDLIMGVLVDSVQGRWDWETTPSWNRVTQLQNVASVRQHGWETTASLNLGPLAVKGTYTMAETRTLRVNPQDYIPSGGAIIGVGESREGIPSHYGNFTVSYAHGPTSVSWTGNYMGSVIQAYDGVWLYVSQRMRLPVYNVRTNWQSVKGSTPGYMRHNVNASQRVSNKASLLLTVTNLSNNFGSETGGLFPSLGRQTQLGVSIRFL